MSLARGSRLVFGLVASLLLGVVGVLDPGAAAHGWLIGFGTAVCAPMGAFALLLIHDLTGGTWGESAGPRLARLAQMLPAFLLWFGVLLFVAPLVYPWIRDPSDAGPDVARLYLNRPFFASRGLILLVVLSIAGVLRARGMSRLAAGLVLTFYAVALDFVAVDWLLSAEPRYTSSAFGAQIIIAQLIAALSLILFDGNPRLEPKARADLAALLLACLLGEAYLILMTLIVHWYGDLPDQAAWFLRRTEAGWRWLEIFGTLFGATLPLAALMFRRVRRSPTLSAGAAAAALLGIFLEMVWLVAPMSGALSGLAGVLALVIISCLTPELVRLFGRPLRSLRHGV